MFTSRSKGGLFETSSPWRRIRPEVGSSNPAIIRRVVVLPEPDGPSIEKNSPSAISRSMPSTAVTWPSTASPPVLFATCLPVSPAKRLTTCSRRTAATGLPAGIAGRGSALTAAIGGLSRDGWAGVKERSGWFGTLPRAMAYVIAEPCIDLLDISCVSVCPVDCIHYEEGVDRKLFIDPNECIDCGACEPECPVNAIFPEDQVPAEWASYTQIDAVWFTDRAAARAAVDAAKPR